MIPQTATVTAEETAKWEAYLARRGVTVKYGQETMLDAINAEALYNPATKTIYLRTAPSRSAFFEEAFHAIQDIQKVPDTMVRNGITIDRWEYEAQRSLIRNRNRLGIPNAETRQTIQNLRDVYNAAYP
jgi:hypothetical protein